VPAVLAGAVDFHDLALGLKMLAAGQGCDIAGKPGTVQFDDAVTVLADKKLAVVLMFGVITENVGVDRFQLVDEVVLQQKIQCPVNGRWCGGTSVADIMPLELIEQFVGLDRTICGDNQLQHLAPGFGQAQSLFITQVLNGADAGFRIHDYSLANPLRFKSPRGGF